MTIIDLIHEHFLGICITIIVSIVLANTKIERKG